MTDTQTERQAGSQAEDTHDGTHKQHETTKSKCRTDSMRQNLGRWTDRGSQLHQGNDMTKYFLNKVMTPKAVIGYDRY